MLITTSRKPGQKTRTFAKIMAKFMNWEYVSRGKASIKDFEGKLALVGERNGNPNSLTIYTIGKQFILSFSIGEIRKLDMDQSPVIFVGNPPFNPTIMDAIPSDTRINFDSPKKVVVTKSDGWDLDFRYNKQSIFKLNLFKWDEERNES
ncbi:MAG: rRNA maturation protein [Archaeoglobaceae archaeon]